LQQQLTPIKAIEWAMKKKVDLISMSFGLTAPQSDIQRAIKTAAAQNILMFAAASNQGGTQEPTFPASDSSVMCIYAADGNGNRSKTNPQTIPGESRFSTVGIALKSAWLEHPENPDIIEARKSGTSFATPIAAGIAACILEFALQQVMEGEKYKQLKTLGKMKRVFNLMKTKSDRPDLLDFMVPGELFYETYRRTTILDLILREVG
jgi:subtilisin family serine protease